MRRREEESRSPYAAERHHCDKRTPTWWDYCGDTLHNSYPTYFKKLPALVEKIKTEKKNSKNYVLFLGETGAETNQQPCLSLVQFQIEDGDGGLIVSAYQRSSDASLGLPSDIYHLCIFK